MALPCALLIYWRLRDPAWGPSLVLCGRRSRAGRIASPQRQQLRQPSALILVEISDDSRLGSLDRLRSSWKCNDWSFLWNMLSIVESSSLLTLVVAERNTHTRTAFLLKVSSGNPLDISVEVKGDMLATAALKNLGQNVIWSTSSATDGYLLIDA